MQNKLDHIVTLKTLGFDIIPVYSIGDKYKQPVIKIKDRPPLTKQELIDWYTHRPTDLVGIRTNKWFSIDIDTVAHGGVDGMTYFKQYLLPYATTPPAMECKTPTGGIHYFYKKTPGYELKQLPATLKGVDIQAGVNNYSIFYLEAKDGLTVEPNNEASPALLKKLIEYQKSNKYSLSPSPNSFHRLTKTGRLLEAIINPTVDNNHGYQYLYKLATELAYCGLNEPTIRIYLDIANNKLNLRDAKLATIVSKIEPNEKLNYIGQALLDLINPPYMTGQRNQSLFKVACSLYGYGLNSNEVWRWLNICNNALSNPLRVGELNNLYNSALKYQ